MIVWALYRNPEPDPPICGDTPADDRTGNGGGQREIKGIIHTNTHVLRQPLLSSGATVSEASALQAVTLLGEPQKNVLSGDLCH